MRIRWAIGFADDLCLSSKFRKEDWMRCRLSFAHRRAIAAGESRARRGRERGVELVEFALILGGLMALTLGIVSFSRAYNVYQTVTRAAREGARMAVLPKSAYDQQGLGQQAFIDSMSACTNPPTTTNTPDTDIFNDYIKPALLASSLNPGNVRNYQECMGWLDPAGTAVNQCGVKISYEYPYRFTIPFLGTGLGTIQIGTHVQMRIEGQPVAVAGLPKCAGVPEP